MYAAAVEDRRKRVLNRSEAATRKILSSAAEKNGAEVHAKMRVADVLDIDRSGLDSDLYGYALRAHFDFVVADATDKALFAVEFDGPHHGSDAKARTNDAKKNAISARSSACRSPEFATSTCSGRRAASTT
jgi:hypothetical protein